MKKFAALGLVAFAGAAQAAVIMSDDFNSGLGNWSITSAGNTAVIWTTNAAEGYSNWTGGTGGCATASSDNHPNSGNEGFDTQLSRAVDLTNYENVKIDFLYNFQNFAGGNDRLEVRGSTDGGATWSVLFTELNDAPGSGSLFALPGTSASVDASSLDGASAAMVQFRYATTDAGAWEWYAQVDDATVSGDLVPAPGALALLGLGGLITGRRRR